MDASAAMVGDMAAGDMAGGNRHEALLLPGTDNIPVALKGGVVAIGNFDGVHRGHRAVLDEALGEARRYGVPALVLTFEPHPRAFLRPDRPVFRLTPPPLKRRLLSALGFDAIIEQPFDAAFAARTAGDFVDGVLLRDLGISHVVTGHDFHFGHDREGTPQFLKKAAAEKGFGNVWARERSRPPHDCLATVMRSRPWSATAESSAASSAFPPPT